MNIIVSVIITTKNEEQNIGNCLQSIKAQTYLSRGSKATLREPQKNIEIIVVDNNSSDDTDETVGRYSRVKLIRETRRGANRARQTGFEASQGEFVAFLDADTDMPHGWIAQAGDAFAKSEPCLHKRPIYLL